MKKILLILSAFIAPMFCNDAKAQTEYVEAKFDQNMSLAAGFDSIKIKELSSDLGLKEKVYVFKTPYVKVAKSSQTSLNIAYAEIWDEENHIVEKEPKSVSTFKGYTFCKVDSYPKLFKWSQNNQNGSFYISSFTVSADTCTSWGFNTIRTKSGDLTTVQKLTADSVFMQGDSIVSITFRTGLYSLVDSIRIGNQIYSTVGKDNFIENRNITIPCKLMLLKDQSLPIEYYFRYLEDGQLVSSTKDVAPLNITKYVEESSTSLWWISLIVLLPIVAIIVFFAVKNKKLKNLVEKKTNEVGEGIAKKQEDGECETAQQAPIGADSAISQESAKDIVADNTIEQSNDTDLKKSEDTENTSSDVTSDNQNESNNKGKDKLSVISKFVENVKTGALIEPNKEIRDLIVECREALLNEGENKCILELTEIIKKSSFNSTYQLTADFSSMSSFSTYLENLVSIVKSQETNSFNAEKSELEKQLEAKDKKYKEYERGNKELSEQKKTAEENLANEKRINASLQAKISGLAAQVSNLTAQVQELNNAEPKKVSFASLEADDQVEIKEQIEQQISENFQLTIDAKQTELNIAQESIKNLNALIGDLRDQLSSEKDERKKEKGAYSGELVQIGAKHLQEVDNLKASYQEALDHQNSIHEAEKAEWKNKEEQLGAKHLQEITELNARHQEAIEHQKSIHEAEKVEWRHQEKEYKAKIKKGEETLKEKLLAAEEAQKLAVQDAIAETEAAAKQILEEEIKARKEEKEQNESRIQKIKEDNVKEKEAIQKKMQKLLDQAINDCDEAINGRKDERQMLAYEMQQHIARMYQQLTIAFNSSVGNFKTEGVELIKEAESMYNWYQSAVVTPFQTEESLTQSEIVEIVQSQSIKQVQDKYSLVSRLSRIVAYSQISTMWIEWMSKQGINTLALRMAYNEICALLGRCKITLVVPSLFSDIFSKNDIYTLNMSFAPIVNFCPGEFDHLKNSNSPIVRDLSHPGYAIDGQIKVGPEVLAQ